MTGQTAETISSNITDLLVKFSQDVRSSDLCVNMHFFWPFLMTAASSATAHFDNVKNRLPGNCYMNIVAMDYIVKEYIKASWDGKCHLSFPGMDKNWKSGENSTLLLEKVLQMAEDYFHIVYKEIEAQFKEKAYDAAFKAGIKEGLFVMITQIGEKGLGNYVDTYLKGMNDVMGVQLTSYLAVEETQKLTDQGLMLLVDNAAKLMNKSVENSGQDECFKNTMLAINEAIKTTYIQPFIDAKYAPTQSVID